MNTAQHGQLIFWVQESTGYSIVGAIHGKRPNAIEVPDFESIDEPALVRTLVLQDHESISDIWQRALDTMLEFKRRRQLNVSRLAQGLFRFRYESNVRSDDAEANDRYRNQRHRAVWEARYGATAEVRESAIAKLRQMAEHANVPTLERALANLHLTALAGLLTRAEQHAFEQWAEERRAATCIGDLESINSIGRQLALRLLKLLEAEPLAVATLQ